MQKNSLIKNKTKFSQTVNNNLKNQLKNCSLHPRINPNKKKLKN